jgi:hypothetical protein
LKAKNIGHKTKCPRVKPIGTTIKLILAVLVINFIQIYAPVDNNDPEKAKHVPINYF